MKRLNFLPTILLSAGLVAVSCTNLDENLKDTLTPANFPKSPTEIDAALVELVVRYVADIGDIHHETFADIALNSEGPVVSGRRLHIERSRRRRLRRIYHR